MTSTSDVADEHGVDALVCRLQLRQFGGRAAFSGPVATVRCHEDNVLLRRRIEEPGGGRVLVVDGGSSLGVALLGDNIAGIAAANDWAGVIVNGCVRDVAALRELDIGIKALGSCPRRSAKAGAGEVDVPVEIGGVTFTPGAMVYSDDDGIVVLERPA